MLKNDMPIIKALHSFSFSSSSELLDPPQRGVGLIETPLSVRLSVSDPKLQGFTHRIAPIFHIKSGNNNTKKVTKSDFW